MSTVADVAAHEAAISNHETEANKGQPKQRAPLWPRNLKIPFIGVTGEFGTGKTLLGLLIDPESCIHYDFEKSSETYASGLPFTRVDMQELARAKFGNTRFRPVDLFKLWREHFQSLPAGRYRVAVIDDVSSLEDGLADYVRANPAEFGHTATQFARSEAMVWGAVKTAYKSLMLSAGIECCVMVAHMRNQFAGARPTGRREAKGKETVMELASLYLMLDRRPDDKGRQPAAPNAVKLKDRLSVFIRDEKTGEFEPRPVLPPRIVGCTPAKIRHYIDNPPDYGKLKKEELALPEQLSDDEKLMLQSQIAADQRETELAKAANIAAVQQAKAQQAATAAASPAARAVDQSAAVNGATETKAVINSALATAFVAVAESVAPGTTEKAIDAAAVDSLDSADEPPVEMVTAEQMETIRVFVAERLKMPIPAYKSVLAKRCTKDGQPVTSAKQLTREQAEELLARMGELWERQKLQQGLAEMPMPKPVTAKPVATNGKPAGGSDAMSRWANGEPPSTSTEQPPFETAATG